ncbi:MAG: hypothetical protein MJ134_06005 [Lachnospiraceae bacterium]|nr:hypothetical protein [Lachnospiraceae bacterium]
MIFEILNDAYNVTKEQLSAALDYPQKGYGLYYIKEKIKLYYSDEKCGLYADVLDNDIVKFKLILAKELNNVDSNNTNL